MSGFASLDHFRIHLCNLCGFLIYFLQKTAQSAGAAAGENTKGRRETRHFAHIDFGEEVPHHVLSLSGSDSSR